MGDPGSESAGSEDTGHPREAPQLYVLDEALDVLFASAGCDPVPSPQLEAVMREIVNALRGGLRLSRIFDGRIVRAEPLAGAGGAKSYAVLLERFSVDGMVHDAAARYGLEPSEARVLDALLRGTDPEARSPGDGTGTPVRDAIRGLDAKIEGPPGSSIVERLLDDA